MEDSSNVAFCFQREMTIRQQDYPRGLDGFAPGVSSRATLHHPFCIEGRANVRLDGTQTWGIGISSHTPRPVKELTLRVGLN